jgi:DNA-binding NarL/FixJ family response regulator
MPEVLPFPQRSLSVTRPLLRVEVEASGPVRRRIVSALKADGVSVVGDGDTPRPSIRIIREDLALPVPLGRLSTKLRQRTPCRIVVVSPDCGPLGARRALRAGADSVVLEPELEDALAPAVRAVAAGLSAIPALLRNAADRICLSHREREVLRLAVGGHTNNEIAATLFLAESTVKSHLSSAYRKLGAASRKDAASLILDPDGGLLEMVLGPGTVPGNGLPVASGDH